MSVAVPKKRGRPPKDPVKLAKYLSDKAAALASGNGLLIVGEAEESKETEAQIISRIEKRFEILYELTEGATVGIVRSLIVSGAGGVGKTFTVERILDAAKEKYGLKTEVVKGVVSPVNLYKLLYRNREKDNVIVLDDADAIFFNEDALSIMKAALDTSITRKISWLSDSHSLKEDSVPTSFLYEGSMIFITNINFQQHLDVGKTKLTPHLQALMTRAIYLDLQLHTSRELVAWINHMVNKNHILVQAGLTHTQEKVAMKYLNDNVAQLRNVSIRTALQLAQFIQAKPDDNEWMTMADVIVKR
jgi:hypothetical protein